MLPAMLMQKSSTYDYSNMILIIQTTGSNDLTTLPLKGIVNVTIDWDDGSPRQAVTSEFPTHTYSDSGMYYVQIDGICSELNYIYVPTADRLKLVGVGSIGATELTLMSSAFEGASNCKSFSAVGSDTSQVTLMNNLFRSWSGFTEQLDLAGIDTSSCTDMSNMFRSLGSSVPPNLSYLDTSNVIYMSSMFNDMSRLTTPPDLTVMDTGKVVTFNSMFKDVRNLTSPPLLSGLDTSSLINTGEMFAGCSDMTTFPDFSNFDTSKVTVMREMFEGWSYFNGDPSSFTLLDTSNVEDMSQIFAGWSSATVFPDISSMNTSKVEDMSYMFWSAYEAQSLPVVTGLDTSAATTIAGMFSNCYKLTTAPDLSSFNTDNVVDMNSMFNGLIRLTAADVLDVGHFNTSNVTNIIYMFHRLGEISGDKFDLDIDLWDVSSVTDASYFLERSGLTTACYNRVLIAWSTQNVQSGVDIYFGNSTYSGQAAIDARALLISKGWFIRDGGEAP